jgi:hypothetical protein
MLSATATRHGHWSTFRFVVGWIDLDKDISRLFASALSSDIQCDVLVREALGLIAQRHDAST